MSELSKQIQSLDLTSVMARLKRELDLTAETLTEAETQYRQFLQLCLDDVGTVPTELADKVWHYHILDTQKYAADCDALFGEFMHHNPHDQMTGALEEAAKQTAAVWTKRFGTAFAPGQCNRSAQCNRTAQCNRSAQCNRTAQCNRLAQCNRSAQCNR